MKKISYRLVFNRKKHLNAQGKALLQIEAYLERKKIYTVARILKIKVGKSIFFDALKSLMPK